MLIPIKNLWSVFLHLNSCQSVSDTFIIIAITSQKSCKYGFIAKLIFFKG